jgi:hypothetical protein
MKTRVYLLMTVILGIFGFSQSEARTMDPNAGAQAGPPSWSVTIPVKNNTSIYQRLAVRFEVVGESLKLPKSNDKFTSGSSQIPKQGKTQSSEQGQIFDRWGNSKNKGSK